MTFDYNMYMMEEGLSEVVGAFLSLAASNVLSFGLSILAYVFTALSLYTIAQRRGIRNPWMAWVPVLNVWILGSISDQYRYVVKGQVRNRRKTLIALKVLQILCAVAVTALLIVAIVQLIVKGESIATMPERAAVEFILKRFLPAIVAAVAIGILALVNVVFVAMAYYDLFASCEPDNKVLFLVLGLLISITMPIFLFICRNKDLGMPARRTAQPEPEGIPAEEAPAEPENEPETQEE